MQFRGKQENMGIKLNSDLSRKRSNLNMNLKENGINVNNGSIVLNGDSTIGEIERTRNN